MGFEVPTGRKSGRCPLCFITSSIPTFLVARFLLSCINASCFMHFL